MATDERRPIFKRVNPVRQPAVDVQMPSGERLKHPQRSHVYRYGVRLLISFVQSLSTTSSVDLNMPMPDQVSFMSHHRDQPYLTLNKSPLFTKHQ